MERNVSVHKRSLRPGKENMAPIKALWWKVYRYANNRGHERSRQVRSLVIKFDWFPFIMGQWTLTRGNFKILESFSIAYRSKRSHYTFAIALRAPRCVYACRRHASIQGRRVGSAHAQHERLNANANARCLRLLEYAILQLPIMHRGPSEAKFGSCRLLNWNGC